MKGWGLIKRFSEDIDFKVGIGDRRKAVCGKKAAPELPRTGSVSSHSGGIRASGESAGRQRKPVLFGPNLAYETLFPMAKGLRPHIRIEMSFRAPAIMPIERPIRSLIGEAQKHAPEVERFPCVDPLETAADK